MQRALTSLVAAIPAGVLTFLLVKVFMDQADSLKTTMMIVVGLTLVASFVVAIMPVILIIPGRTKSAAATAGGKAAAKDSDDALEVTDDDDDVEVSDDVEEAAEELSATSDFDLDDSGSGVMSDSSGEIDTGPTSSKDDMESFDFDDEEEEEQPKPKKRKK